ncbi:hypothetical protein FVER53590_25665 [Fusarium verticillioides]|nr:hypothetical protein FVER53590_25665 [Fusarium verticillioides]
MIFLPLVLDDLTTIKVSAQGFLAQESRLDVLYNNAGVMVPPQGSRTVRSKDCRRSVISIALKPGNIVTNLQQNMPRMQLAIFKLISHAPKNGAYTQLVASHSPTITEKENGCWDLGNKYWEWTEEQVNMYK